jgi:hypothetical protein
VAATSGEILRRWSLWGRRPASPPGQSPVGPCPFLNAKSEEWRVKNEERKGLLMFHSTLITLHSSLFTLHSSDFEREHPYETLQLAPWRHQDPPNVHRGVIAHFQCREYAGNRHVHGTPITLHSSLFTLHSSDFERSRRLVVSRPPLSLRRPLQSPECESNGLNSARNGGRWGPERSFCELRGRSRPPD